ncbi:MAG: CvpA family protein [Halanaerobiaceae bacterium]|nr:CvpA family protein [Halanaerobiaceae bacterium]
MNIAVIDLVVMVIFLYFGFTGYNRGLVKQASTIIGIILALLISINYYDLFVPLLEIYLAFSRELLQFLSFAILFILINVFVFILGNICKKILDVLFLGIVDRVAGAVLGLVKGFLISYFLVLLLSYIPFEPLVDHISASVLAARILDLTPFLQDTIQDIFNS